MSKPKDLNLTVNRQNIVDQMAAWLYAISAIDDDKEITDIQFGDMTSKTVPLKITYKTSIRSRDKEVKRN